MTDKFEVEISDDDIKVVTDKVSAPNHKNADNFLAFLAQLTGGKMTKTKRHPNQIMAQRTVVQKGGH